MIFILFHFIFISKYILSPIGTSNLNLPDLFILLPREPRLKVAPFLGFCGSSCFPCLDGMDAERVFWAGEV